MRISGRPPMRPMFSGSIVRARFFGNSVTGDNVELWIDGVLEASGRFTLSIGTDHTNFGTTFSGTTNRLEMGSWFVFDRTLSTEEAAQIEDFLRVTYITDTVAPVLSGAAITAITDRTATISFEADEVSNGNLIVSTVLGTPGAPQIEVGQDISGTDAGVDFWEQDFEVAEGTNTVPIEGLTPSETYYCYVSARDEAGLARVLYLGSLDTEAELPAINTLRVNAGDLRFTPSVSGVIYFYFDTSTALVEGTLVKSTAQAETAVAYGSFSVTANEVINIPDISGLSAGDYVLHMTLEASSTFAIDPAFQVTFTQ